MIHEDDAVAEGSAAAISAAAVVADVVNFAAAEAPSTFPPPRLPPRHTQQQPLLPLHAQPVGEETRVCIQKTGGRNTTHPAGADLLN